MRNILILPIGEVDRETIDSLAGAVRKTFGVETVAAESIPVPQKTYNPRRSQYNSTRILQALEALKSARYGLLLGVINEDLYVPELNFVFGQADMKARIGVIGLRRLRQDFYGFEPDRELFYRRAAKEAIHELGHVIGLDHCADPRCVMHFSNSLGDTDVKKEEFCPACRNNLGRLTS